MSLLVPPRYVGEELIDQPGQCYADMERALREIQWVNRHLSGWRVLQRLLPDLLSRVPTTRPVEVLDLGTGSADLPRAIVAWGRAHGRDIRVVGVDNNPEVVEFARREVAHELRVRIVRADIHHLPFPAKRFDLVLCSLFLHHFQPDEAVALLEIMASQARYAMLVNDLERHRVAYWAIWALSRIYLRGRLFQHDAPVSVLRAYRRSELRDLVERASLGSLAVERIFPFRLAAHGVVNDRPCEP